MIKQLSYIGWVTVIAVFFLSCNEPGKSKRSDDSALVPQWSKEVVWYELSPDRFRNGDSTNDPVFNDILGAWPQENILPWQVHSWTSDWYEMQGYELENGKDIWFNIARRRYGGDLQGILDQLDYLKELGVGALQLTPVFMSPSAHKFDATCLHHIDPSFGPHPQADLQMIAQEIPEDPSTWKWTSADSLMLRLIEEIHHRHMKIIFEVSFNYLGMSSFAFQDVLINQEKSRFKDWFFIRSFEDASRGTLLEYKGWKGMKEYPELREDQNGMDAGAQKYLFDATRRWMDPSGNGDISKGVDGWWLDEANSNSHGFWKEWSKLVRSVNPQAYLTGDMVIAREEMLPYIQGKEYVGVNYPFLFLSSQYFFKGKHLFNTQQFDSSLRVYRDAFSPEINLGAQNVLSTFKTDRVGSRAVNRRTFSFLDQDRFFSNTYASNHWYKTEKPKRKDLEIVKLMALFQMTYPGIPLVYYGDEVAMWGAGDPCNRKPMIWSDLEYSDENYSVNGMKKRIPDKVKASEDMLNHYKELIGIRNASKALQLGDFETVLIDNDREIYAFSRSYANEQVYVVINNSPQMSNVDLPVHSNGIFINAMDDNREIVAEQQKLSLDIRGNCGAILIKRSNK